MAAISETGMVVFALVVRMPEADQRRHGAAASRQHKPESSNGRPPAPFAGRAPGDFSEERPHQTDYRSSARDRRRRQALAPMLALDSSHPAVRMPVLSRNRRRVDFLSVITKLERGC
jgi:hypothetical protein